MLMASDTGQADTGATQPVSDSAETRKSQLIRSTLTVIIAFAATKIVSLAQVVIIARKVGLRADWDAYVTANRLPELIFILIAGGALANAFIPVFSGYLAQGDKERAWKIATHVVNTVFVATLIASALVFIIAPALTKILAPGFDAATRQLTTELMRILIFSTLIFSVSGIVMGILQSHNHFLLPALAPVMLDFGILFGVIFLLGPMGLHGIALGAVLGAAMHLGIQVPGLIRFRARWWPELGLKDPVLWQVIRLMLPRVAGLGVFNLNFLIMTRIASMLGERSVSALDWGWKLMQIPETLIGTAMGTVILPTLAALSELGDDEGKRNSMSGALRFIVVATIPATIGLILIGRPLISLLEGEAWDAAASDLVYSTLQYFALGLVVHSALEIVARSFYADKDTLTPLWAALGGATINLVFSLLLSGVSFTALLKGSYTIDPDSTNRVGGLALANSMGVAFEVIVLLWILRGRWRGINENALVRTTLKTLASSLAMALMIVVINAVWQGAGLTERGGAFNILHLLLAAGTGAGVFFGTAIALKMEEVNLLVQLVLRRVRSSEGAA
jgi:putative peptidoglycan lipid II flippase